MMISKEKSLDDDKVKPIGERMLENGGVAITRYRVLLRSLRMGVTNQLIMGHICYY